MPRSLISAPSTAKMFFEIKMDLIELNILIYELEIYPPADHLDMNWRGLGAIGKRGYGRQGK